MKGIKLLERLLQLERLLDDEVNKPIHEMDTEKISEYVNELLSLQGKSVNLTSEEIKERVSRIPFK